VTFNRATSPQAKSNPDIGTTGGNCPGTIGGIVEFDEGVDTDLKRLDGGGKINPAFLPRDPNNNCAPIFPHQYLRVNTIFEVVKAHGGTTAWTDKHPSYEWTNGPSGKGVDDFFGPEINSIPVALPFPGCTPVPFADNAPDDGWTNSFQDIQCYDETHVQAVLNQIDASPTTVPRKSASPPFSAPTSRRSALAKSLRLIRSRAPRAVTPTFWELRAWDWRANSTSSINHSENS